MGHSAGCLWCIRVWQVFGSPGGGAFLLKWGSESLISMISLSQGNWTYPSISIHILHTWELRMVVEMISLREAVRKRFDLLNVSQGFLHAVPWTCFWLVSSFQELERSWREYDRLSADVTLAKSNLLEQLEALGSPQVSHAQTYTLLFIFVLITPTGIHFWETRTNHHDDSASTNPNPK